MKQTVGLDLSILGVFFIDNLNVLNVTVSSVEFQITRMTLIV